MNGSFVLDRQYFRDQTYQAVKTFVAPLMGVYYAINPPSVDANTHPGTPQAK